MNEARKLASMPVFIYLKKTVFWGVFFLMGYVAITNSQQKNGVEVRSIKNDKKKSLVYFPDQIFSKRDDLNSFITTRYSKYLSALQEPSLYEQGESEIQHVFRFTWLRTFHHPVSIRLEILPSGMGRLYSKMTNGVGGAEPGILIINKLEIVGKQNVDEFLGMVKNENFWSFPTKIKDVNPDGAQWILEGRDGDKYHVVNRWSPDEGAIREMSLYLLNISNLNIIDIY